MPRGSKYRLHKDSGPKSHLGSLRWLSCPNENAYGSTLRRSHDQHLFGHENREPLYSYHWGWRGSNTDANDDGNQDNVYNGMHSENKGTPEGIHPGIRGQVVAKLRRLMLRELHQALVQGMRLISILNTHHMGNDTIQDCDDDVINHMAQFILNNLDITDNENATEVSREEVNRLLHELQREMTGGSSASSRDNTTSHAMPRCSLPKSLQIQGQGDEILSLADDLTQTINNMIMTLPAEDQLEARRCMVIELIDFVQIRSAQTLTTLLLLAYYLPQPNQLQDQSNTRRFGRHAVECIEEAMRATFTTSASSSLQQAPFGQQDVAQLLPALGPLIMEALNFLDTGGVHTDDEETTSTDHADNNEDMDNSKPAADECGSGGTGRQADCDLREDLPTNKDGTRDLNEEKTERKVTSEENATSTAFATGASSSKGPVQGLRENASTDIKGKGKGKAREDKKAKRKGVGVSSPTKTKGAKDRRPDPDAGSLNQWVRRF